MSASSGVRFRQAASRAHSGTSMVVDGRAQGKLACTSEIVERGPLEVSTIRHPDISLTAPCTVQVVNIPHLSEIRQVTPQLSIA